MKRPSRIALLTKDNDIARALAGRLALQIRRRNHEPVFDRETARALGIAGGFPRTRIPPDCRLIVSLGGDGTLLSAARSAPDGAEILGVNIGALGFLAGVSRRDAPRFLKDALEGKLRRDVRRFLQVEIERRGSTKTAFVLNDAVLTRGALSRIARFKLKLDGRPFSSMRADGLILSTPTGSTAYNLSAGGPILFPEVEAFLVTPICPHALTQRTVVLPAGHVVEVTAEAGSPEGIFLTLDGQEGMPLPAGAIVRVRGSRRSVTLLRSHRNDYFATLAEKLNWGA